MGNLEQLIEIIDVVKFANMMNAMDNKSPDYARDFKRNMDDYINKVVKLLENSSIEVVIGALDYFYTKYFTIVPLILDKGSEKIMRAEMVIDKVKGYNASSLKNELETLTAIESIRLTNFNTDKHSMRKRDSGIAILNVVNRFLKDKDPEEWDAIVEKDLLKFAKNFTKIEKRMFDGSNTDFYNKFDFVKNIFLMDDVDPKLLSEIYKAIVCNDTFVTFDFSEIIMEKTYLINEVKGMYKKFPFASFDDSEFVTEEDFEEFDATFKELCELNKDDEDGLRWFFLELSKVITNDRLLEHISSQEYYQFYTYKSMTDLYEEAMDKMRKGSLDIDDKILESLGTYDKFVDRFEEFFDLLINSDDEHIKKYALSLLIALVEKLKKENGLDFEFTLTKEKLDNDNGGSYNNHENVLYINQYALLGKKNAKEGLVTAVDIIYHEVTHAIQIKELETSDKLSYDNLIMAIDECVVDMGGVAYYKNNYEYISYEIDAREKAFVQTMKLFKPYPVMQELYKKTYIETPNPLAKYMRRNIFLDSEAYFGIVENFTSIVNMMLQGDKEEDEGFYNEIFKILDRFPVIKQFFEIDRNRRRIYSKSTEYFESRKKEIEEMDDSLEKREQLYSIEAFKYAKRIDDYFKEFLWDFEPHKPEYSERVTKEATFNVGEPPSR